MEAIFSSETSVDLHRTYMALKLVHYEMLYKYSNLDGVDSSGSGYRPVVDSCEYGHEISVHKRREIY